MKHLGDITKINGAEIPIVDVICGGSPCQDLSVAGKRAGLDGERSGLFMEQVRVIKEMREHDRCTGRPDEYLRPRYMVWENVPGAFSSGTPKGEDFRIVLEETAKISKGDAVIPRPEGGWTKQGCIMGDGWSIAWRTSDAQYFGTPQRRKRICLLADFNGFSAGWVLFDPKLERTTENGEPVSLVRDSGREAGREIHPIGESLPGDHEPGGTKGEGTPGSSSDGIRETGIIRV